MYKYLYSH